MPSRSVYPSKPAHVYVLEAPHGCKVGRTRNPDERLRSIEAHSGIRFSRVWFTLPTAYSGAIESAAHNRLSGKRLSGEYFDADFSGAVSAVCAAESDITKRIEEQQAKREERRMRAERAGQKSQAKKAPKRERFAGLRRCIAENIASARKKKGWNQPQLAEKSGVSQKTISNAETAGNITVGTLEAIAGALGEDPRNLMRCVGENNLQESLHSHSQAL